MQIAIIGGGISGLALAHELARDHHVTVLESAPGPRGGGYMIDFFGPGYAAAERMGVIDALRARGRDFAGVRYGLPDGTESGRIDAAPLVAAAGGRYFSILRPELELGLLECLPDDVDLLYGIRVVGVHPGGERILPTVELAHGQTLRPDLVIACDGVRSPVREVVAPGHGAILPMGYRVASYLFEDADMASDLGDRMLMTDTVGRTGWLYAADEHRVGVMFAERTGAGRTGAGRTGAGRAEAGRTEAGRAEASGGERPAPDPEQLRRDFAGLHPQVDAALDRAPASFYEDVVAQSSAPCWSRGRLVLAGDAAHAPSLLAGQGASLAIAGAEALARSLRAAGPHVEVGLAEYERRWRPTTEKVGRAGRRSAAAFIPATARQLRLQQVARRAIGLPGISRLLARQFIAA
ncbi:FAD-dependent oxidoreductase [Brachybacterium sp. DNPG3]